MPLNPKRTIDLSPRAASMLALPIQAHGYELLDAGGALIGSIDHFGDNALDASFADFVAALVNEALTPAAPAVTISPETTTELRQLITTEIEAEQPVMAMCGWSGCSNPAEEGYVVCSEHWLAARDVTPSWTAEDIMRREG